MVIFKKIQNLPESGKKKIFWIVIIIVGLILLILYVNDIQKGLKNFQIEQIKLPEMPKTEIPKLEMPEINEEGLKGLEEMMKEK